MSTQENEVTEMWRVHKAARADKRASNRRDSARALVDAGIVHTTHNNGAHIVIQTDSVVLDFWPGTGRWKVRKTGEYGFGIKTCLKKIKG